MGGVNSWRECERAEARYVFGITKEISPNTLELNAQEALEGGDSNDQGSMAPCKYNELNISHADTMAS
jgi:hypothetical protein